MCMLMLYHYQLISIYLKSLFLLHVVILLLYVILLLLFFIGALRG